MTEDAWTRLQRWRAERSTDGDQALAALADVGETRRALDQAELAAVRAARQDGRSWTEIATQLGVTRQSAWERWRDLDGEDAGDGEGVLGRVAGAVAGAASRRRERVTVPHVVGLPWEEARALLWEHELVGMHADPDAPPSGPGYPERRVTAQTPESGARVSRGSTVRLWTARGGGGAGDREPRLPKPTPRSGRAMRPEPSDEAVG